ncbi:MAG: SprB repeat-containing protein [Bacteroidetes bacterium]|nr:SprB repeat-containing protein [Bacteroidota bacterium]
MHRAELYLYSYDWAPGGILTAKNRINLQAGNYDVTVTDSKGCTEITTGIVSEPSAVAGTLTPTDATCFGGTNGSADIVANGGTAPYTFLWNDGSTGTQLSNIIAGTYTVTISDNNGCTQQETVIVGEATAINLIVNATDASCGNANGSAQVNGNGGTGGLTYQWSTGTPGTNIINLSSGAYTVIATDANGCTASGTTAVADMGDSAISLLNSTDALCFGSADGNAEVTINSGNGPYTYQWLPSGGNASAANGLTAGAYSVDVTDINACPSTLNVTISEPASIVLQLSSTQAICGNANGSATVLANGGSGAYLYSWSNGDLTATANALAAGNYDVTVTDANGCSTSASVSVTQPSSLAVVNASTDVTCFNGSDGSASVNVNGGNAPYSYLWSNGDITSQLNNISAGSYTVTVSDANGCSFIDVINVNEAPAINLVINTVDATCGGANGSVQVNGNGGTGALSYLWDSGQSSTSLNGLAAGSYTVTATDASGCSQSAIANISNLGGPQATLQNNTDVSCAGGNDGSAEIIVNSGSGPFTYQWQPAGGNALQANGLSAGNYTVVVTDINGCIGNVNIIINEPVALALQTNSTSYMRHCQWFSYRYC